MADVIVQANRYTVDSLYQWDINQELKIHGLSVPSIPEIHFTNDTMDKAIVKQSIMDDAGVITVDIPNSLLQKAYKINVYVCIREGDSFKSLYLITIPVKARNKPNDYTIEVSDEEVYSFNKLENELVNFTEKYNDTLVKLTATVNDTLENTVEDLNQTLEKQLKTGAVKALRETNRNGPITFWIGTLEEYEKINEKTDNCLYIVTDELTENDMRAIIEVLENEISNNTNEIDNLRENFTDHQTAYSTLINNLTEQVSGINTTIEGLNNKDSNIETEINRLRENVNSTNTAHSNLISNLNDLVRGITIYDGEAASTVTMPSNLDYGAFTRFTAYVNTTDSESEYFEKITFNFVKSRTNAVGFRSLTAYATRVIPTKESDEITTYKITIVKANNNISFSVFDAGADGYVEEAVFVNKLVGYTY